VVAVSSDFTLYPATQADMRGGNYEAKPSLEVIYDEA
jgi:chlorophyllide a reductase subunit X